MPNHPKRIIKIYQTKDLILSPFSKGKSIRVRLITSFACWQKRALAQLGAAFFIHQLWLHLFHECDGS